MRKKGGDEQRIWQYGKIKGFVRMTIPDVG
jgi:hypothetical protein